MEELAKKQEEKEEQDKTLTAPGLLLVYSEREAGTKQSFRSSIFVNKDILFINDSRSVDDFILMDRTTKVINSVVKADRSIFQIMPKPVTIKPPIEIDYVEESQPSSAIPKVQGKQASHYRYLANGQHCYDSVTIDKSFMPDVADAMRDFRQVLAGEHASTLGAVPLEMHDACDLAVNIFHATKHMGHGLPLREWDQKGFQRFLMDFKMDFRLKKELVELPEDYRRYSIPTFTPREEQGI